LLVLGALACSFASACIVSGSRCDAHQVRVHDEQIDVCVCEPNAVMNADGHGCTPCGEDEVVKDGACACKDGFQKPAAGGACERTDIGAACDAETPCADAYPYCVVDGVEQGYCTSDSCADNAMCPSGWSCEAEGSMRYCRKAPTGLGVHCDTSADCASYEANYCESFQAHSCLLAGCAIGGSTCPNEWGCCDFSALLGTALSFCLAPDALQNGACPMGGKLVKP
jgi:hypothetical protein